MKKIATLLLSLTLLFTFSACSKAKTENIDNGGNKTEKKSLQFGMGVISRIENITSAKDGVNGQGEMTTTAAAVLLDKDGKIVNCVIDTMENSLAFGKAGDAKTLITPKTKYEYGDAYGMVAHGGAKLEWYKQVDNFTKAIKGKDLKAIKALITEDDKTPSEIINAGCTIKINDFAKAIVKAMENAKDSKASKGDNLKIAFVGEQTAKKSADSKTKGSNEITIDITAAALSSGEVTAIDIDTVVGSVSFDKNGKSSESPKEITSKRQKGDDYGLDASDETTKDWFEQVDELKKLIIGKNADEILALEASDGKGNSEVQKASCTIVISGIIKSAAKAAS